MKYYKRQKLEYEQKMGINNYVYRLKDECFLQYWDPILKRWNASRYMDISSVPPHNAFSEMSKAEAMMRILE